MNKTAMLLLTSLTLLLAGGGAMAYESKKNPANTQMNAAMEAGDTAKARSLCGKVGNNDTPRLYYEGAVLCAESGQASAMGFLSWYHIYVKELPERSLYWGRKGAELGNAESMLVLCVIHNDGIGMPRDIVQAERWCTLAAAKGDPTARKILFDIRNWRKEQEADRRIREADQEVDRTREAIYENLQEQTRRSWERTYR